LTLAPDAVRVMLCDDSATVRAAIGRVLEADKDIRIVARVGDGKAALATMESMPRAERPQVVLLDLEMPVMDGMTALPLLLRQEPKPIVIVASALSQRGASVTMQALRAGAADYVPKPGAAGGGLANPAFCSELVAKVKGWARLHRKPVLRAPAPAAPVRGMALPLGWSPKIIGIGCSTGGPQALAGFVKRLGAPLRMPIVVVQHMPTGFTTMLADHLNRLGSLPCAEAQDGQPLLPGHLYVAPGDRHLLVEAQGHDLIGRLTEDPPENFCRPAVDPMMRSRVAACGNRVLAVMLTGMGQDGLLGCRAVKSAGGRVLAQDEASSVVWGMPGAVAKAGLAEQQGPPEALADSLRSFAISRPGGRA